jgi:hypothetical protein
MMGMNQDPWLLVQDFSTMIVMPHFSGMPDHLRMHEVMLHLRMHEVTLQCRPFNLRQHQPCFQVFVWMCHRENAMGKVQWVQAASSWDALLSYHHRPRETGFARQHARRHQQQHQLQERWMNQPTRYHHQQRHSLTTVAPMHHTLVT